MRYINYFPIKYDDYFYNNPGENWKQNKKSFLVLSCLVSITNVINSKHYITLPLIRQILKNEEKGKTKDSVLSEECRRCNSPYKV